MFIITNIIIIMIKGKTNTLMDKNGMKINKLTNNEYTVSFSIQNNQLILPSIILSKPQKYTFN